MSFDHYVRSGQKLLRCGYTTGTCAALAARGAAELLLSGAVPRTLQLVTPKGWPVQVLPAACRMEGDAALCGVEKDAGDDCDITDGMTVQAVVSRTDGAGILIDGGEGVGRVTRPGLDQPVGAAAINSVPRRMIGEEVRDVCRRFGYTGGLRVEIRIPGGAEAAQKTFNPKLGIEGGLSVLGTSGVVEPMSEQALVDTIGLEIRQAAAQSKRLILTPGNYGADFCTPMVWTLWACRWSSVPISSGMRWIWRRPKVSKHCCWWGTWANWSSWRGRDEHPFPLG